MAALVGPNFHPVPNLRNGLNFTIYSCAAVELLVDLLTEAAAKSPLVRICKTCFIFSNDLAIYYFFRRPKDSSRSIRGHPGDLSTKVGCRK